MTIAWKTQPDASVDVHAMPHGAFLRTRGASHVAIFWHGLGAVEPEPVCRLAHDELDRADLAVIDFMHAHPDLCETAPDADGTSPRVPWSQTSSSAISVARSPRGIYLRIRSSTHEHDHVVVEEQIAGGDRIEVCRVSPSCGDDAVERRIAARVARHEARNPVLRIAS